MPRCNFDTLSEAREFVRALGVSQIDAERLIQALAEVSRPRSVIARLQAALHTFEQKPAPSGDWFPYPMDQKDVDDDGMGGDG